MILLILSVRDRTADAFGQPFYTASRGGAIRSFADEVNRLDPQNMLSKHPEDFDLFELGTFDDNTAQFNLLEAPRQIAIGKDCVK